MVRVVPPAPLCLLPSTVFPPVTMLTRMYSGAKALFLGGTSTAATIPQGNSYWVDDHGFNYLVVQTGSGITCEGLWQEGMSPEPGSIAGATVTVPSFGSPGELSEDGQSIRWANATQTVWTLRPSS